MKRILFPIILNLFLLPYYGNAQSRFDKQFLKNYYYKNSEFYSSELEFMKDYDESGELIGTIKSIIPNPFFKGIKGKESTGDEIQAFIKIDYDKIYLNVKSIIVSGSLKEYSPNCINCISLIDKLKVGVKIKFKTLKIGNGDGSSFWFTDIIF